MVFKINDKYKMSTMFIAIGISLALLLAISFIRIPIMYNLLLELFVVIISILYLAKIYSYSKGKFLINKDKIIFLIDDDIYEIKIKNIKGVKVEVVKYKIFTKKPFAYIHVWGGRSLGKLERDFYSIFII